MAVVYAVEDLLDGLIHLGGVFDGHGSLKNASPANILVDNRLEIFRLPQRIFLEEKLECVVENRHERHRLLAAALAEQEESAAHLGH